MAKYIPIRILDCKPIHVIRKNKTRKSNLITFPFPVILQRLVKMHTAILIINAMPNHC